MHIHAGREYLLVHAGLEFFPGFLNAGRRAIVDRAALEYSGLGR